MEEDKNPVGQSVMPQNGKSDVIIYVPLLSKQCLTYELANIICIETLLKMCGVNYKVVETKNAKYMSSVGYVPLVQYGNMALNDYNSIVKFFSDKLVIQPACITLCPSSSTQLNESLEQMERRSNPQYMKMAFSSLIKQLEDYEKFISWLDGITYVSETKPKVSSVHPFPLNYIIVNKEYNNIKNYLREKNLTDKLTPDDVFKNVATILNVFSLHFTNDFFVVGNKPKAIDALLFGHLTALIRNKTNRKSPQFQDVANYILSNANLMTFIETIEKYVG